MATPTFLKVSSIARLTKDAEMRYTPSGQAVSNMNAVVDVERTSASGEKTKTATWLRLTVWGKLAEAINQYLVKGKLIFFEGHLVADPATGNSKLYSKADGTSGTSFEINVSDIKLLSGGQQNGGAAPEADGAAAPASEEEIPF